MNISDFVAQVSYAGGLARVNRYRVDIPVPKLVGSSVQYSDINMMQLFCDSVQLPGLNVNTAQNRTFGEVREIPYEFLYEPIQLTFYTDATMKIKSIFDYWIKSIQTGTSRTYNYYKDYIAPTMRIYVDNIQDETTYVVVAYEVYPKLLSAINLSYEGKDVMKVSVSLVHKYWESYNMSMTDPVQPAPTPQRNVETRTVTNTITVPESLPIGNPMGDVSGWGNGW